ncbi:MAG TPA: GFA family protein [Candidatus Competibacter phosphatis]|nr:GFA family protein [Candidatus Competibacter phosphatis]
MIAVCHCKTCQKNTGSAFSTNLVMPEGAIKLTGDSRGGSRSARAPTARRSSGPSAPAVARRSADRARPIRGSSSSRWERSMIRRG